MGARYPSEPSTSELDDVATAEVFNQTQREALFKKTTGIKVSSAAKMMCNGVAFFASLSDTKLLICRGYIVFPNEKMFMEHWWTQLGNDGAIFDPLTDLMFGSTKLDRLAIDKLEPKSFEAVGSFDCNEMVGVCSRRAKNLPDCEWCVARYSIEQQGPYKAYELAFGLSINPHCITDARDAQHKHDAAKQKRYDEQYESIRWSMSARQWWYDLQALNKQKQFYETACHNSDVRDISIKVIADRRDELTAISDAESRKEASNETP